MTKSSSKANKSRKTGLLALAGETARMAQNMMVLDQTEKSLEREIAREERGKPRTKLARVRQKGEHVLHSKYVLLAIVILNCVDCLLVLGELMLDIKYVTDLLTKEYDRSEDFINSMKALYPIHLGSIGQSDIKSLEHEILNAHVTWDNPSTDDHRHRRSDDADRNNTGNHTEHGHDVRKHSLEVNIAHGLHKASISILGILVVETLFKIFCLGKQMLERKLEIFDGVVVVASFIVDLVFLKGLQQFAVQDFVLILAFMVPWRIIRVVNSKCLPFVSYISTISLVLGFELGLVVAIMDHEHFRLKLLYKQKKKIANELKDAKVEIKGLEACVDALERMAGAAGISESNVKSKLDAFKRFKSKNSAMAALGSFAMGGEAMARPLVTRKYPSSLSLITEKSDKSATARRFQELLFQNPGSTVTELVANIVAEKRAADQDIRPRSRSALDPVSHIETLAGNSADFIATMNNDVTENK